MRLLFVIALLLTLAGCDKGGGQSSTLSTSANPCPQTIDNGCAASRTAYITNAEFNDSNFAADSSQSGQLPISPTTAQIAARNAALHASGANFPFVDYPIGSASPASLAPISTFPGDHICSAVVAGGTGNPMGGGPYIFCQGDSTTSGAQTEVLKGYDFSNNGAGTGTDCVVVIIQNSNFSTVSYQFINTFHQANYQMAKSPTWNNCWSGASNSQGVTAPGGDGALIYLVPSPTGNVPSIELDNVTIDGNFQNAPVGGNYGRISGIFDNRGTAGPPYSSIKVRYSLFENLGHNPIVGPNGGTVDIAYSAAVNVALSGISLAHGEFVLYTGANATRSDNYTGNLYYLGSVQTTNVDTTAAFFLTTGQTNNTNFPSATVSDNLIVLNKTACTNAGPYGPNNACTGGTQNGLGLFTLTDTSSVGTFHIHGNVIDGTGAFYCYANVTSNTSSGSAPNLVAAVTTTSGPPVITITSQVTGYLGTGSILQYVWQPGEAISDTNAADGFTPTTILSYGSYNISTGVGTVKLGALSEPLTMVPGNSWLLYTAVTSTDYGNDNWSIGGTGLTSRQITFGAQPWGQVVCQ